MRKTKVSRYKYKWGGIAGRVVGTGVGALAGNPMLGMQIGGMAGDVADQTLLADDEKQRVPLERSIPNQGFRYGGKYKNGGRVSNKISKLRREGKPQDQAVAIAMSMEERGELKYGGKYRYGGTNPAWGEQGAVRMGRNAKKYMGPKHEQGGIPIDGSGNPTTNANATAEVEGGETEQGGYVFSDTLIVPNSKGATFADVHEQLVQGNAPDKAIQQLAQLQERVQKQQGVKGGDEMMYGGKTKKGMFMNGGKRNYAFGGYVPPEETKATDEKNPLAPNKTMIAVNRFLPSAMKLGMAAFGPRNDKPLPKVRAERVPVTSPVFNQAKRNLGRNYRAFANNPNASPNQRLAAQAQYQQARSDVAGKEADYRMRQMQQNATRAQEAAMINQRASAMDRDVKAQEDAARMKLVQDAVQMPISMYRADNASKRQAISEAILSADRIKNPVNRRSAIRRSLRAIGLPKAEIDSILSNLPMENTFSMSGSGEKKSQ